MKILFVIDKMQDYAGIERILTCKMNYITTQTTHQVFLTTYEQQCKPLSFPLNKQIAYHPLDVPIPLREESSFLTWLKDYLHTRNIFKHHFKELLATIQPNIVVCTIYSYPVLDIIINASYVQRIKTIMESHTQGETIKMCNKFRYNKKLFYLFSLWDMHILKSLRNCNCVVTLTEQDIPFWEPFSCRTIVIPNMLTIRPKRVKNYAVKRVISAGRYMSEKGFDRLLEAWHHISSEFHDWQLFIFGNGDRHVYQTIVDKFEMNDRVHLMPATTDIAAEFSKSSIYVMSSRYEGFGLVLAEAMICGLPCIAFDCPYGPREIIKDGEDGFLVKDGNIPELTQKIEFLMSQEQLRQIMGEQAILNITRYQPESIMPRWFQLYKSL